MSSTRTALAIVGAGPAGIDLAVRCKRANLPYLHFEAHQIGHSLSDPARGPLEPDQAGYLRIDNMALPVTADSRLFRKQYLSYLREVVNFHQLDIHIYESVTHLRRMGDCFLLRSTCHDRQNREYRAERVVLATGDCCMPVEKNFVGCDSPLVQHSDQPSHHYFRSRVLLTGPNSELASRAVQLQRAGAWVIVAGESVQMPANEQFRTLAMNGEIEWIPGAELQRLERRRVLLRLVSGKQLEREVDFVLPRYGYRPDYSLLHKVNVTFSSGDLSPVYDPHTMETSVSGLYLSGAVLRGQNGAPGQQFPYQQHNQRILQALGAEQPAASPVNLVKG